MYTSALYISAAVLSFTALLLMLKRDLMMLQQNSYRTDRFKRWMYQNGESTTTLRIIALAAAMLALIKTVPCFLGAAVICLVSLGIIIKLATAHYKKPLVFTSRATRIYLVSASLSLIVCAVLAMLFQPLIYFGAVAATALIGFSYCVTISANIMLAPVQNMINRRYYKDAERILQSMPRLKVIGITGSYGKTSTKHYLYRILSEQFETVMTPGSFNTTLGVVRTIRENLRPYTEIFIAEMGAKQKGDIKEICDLVHPSIGIVTAVGPQHLESFGTIENVCSTKFELVDTLPADGLAIINNDFEPSAARDVTNTATLRYGIQNTGNCSVTATDITISSEGTSFAIVTENGKFNFNTRLVGECNVSNLMAAISTALYLGMTPDTIARAVEKIEQVEHRLNMKSTPGGITIIDDAFNSNPTGSKMALDVLHSMTSGKRIVVTPGMIELGDRQFELNKLFGMHIAESADTAIIVGEYNREAIISGITEAHTDCEIHQATDFTAAQTLLQSIINPGDTVLYENDLPDTFK